MSIVGPGELIILDLVQVFMLFPFQNAFSPEVSGIVFADCGSKVHQRVQLSLGQLPILSPFVLEEHR